MTILYRTYPKSVIPSLPLFRFEGRTVVIQSVGEAERAVATLRREPLVGIDSETKPAFKRGVRNKVALLQIATPSLCFLFRLNLIGLPECLIDFLSSDAQPLKVGLSLADDFHMLRGRADFEPRGYLDLQKYVQHFGIEDLSLQKLFANCLGRRISKREQLSNWEADVLSPEQKRYAATDAVSCIALYECLHHLKETGDWELLDFPEDTLPPKPRKTV